MASSETPPSPLHLVIGVLALQGGYLEHVAHLTAPARLGLDSASVLEVRTAAELGACDALVIPGGESTAIGLIAARAGLLEPLRAWVAQGRPTWGTCAGLVMLAERADGTKAGGQALLGGLDATVHRNFFGSQLASFEAPLVLAEAGDAAAGDDLRAAVLGSGADAASASFTGVFIRAPAILQWGPDVLPLAWVEDRQRGDANVPALPGPGAQPVGASPALAEAARVLVAARTASLLVTAFHPELTASCGFHRFFAQMAARRTGKPLLLRAGGAAGGRGAQGGAEQPTPHGAALLDARIAARVVDGSSPVAGRR